MPRTHGGPAGSQRRITIPVPPELSDRIDAAIHALPGETLKSLTLRALSREIDRLEEDRGGGLASPFPPAGRPPPGRPRKDPQAARGVATGTTASGESSSEVERLMQVLEQGEHAASPRAKGQAVGKR